MLRRYTEAMRDRYRDQAWRRFLARFLVTMTLYIVLLIAVRRLMPSQQVHVPLRYLFAALPGLPIAAVFWLLGRYIIDIRDEYQRLMEVRKALVATGITMSIVSILGFEESLAGLKHLPLFYAPIIWFGALGAAAWINRFIERDRS